MVDPIITSRFNEVYDSTYKAVLSYVTAKCGNTADIQDIMQETYVELYQILMKRGVDYIKNKKALCLRIAKQKLSRHYTFLERLKIFVPLITSNNNGDEVEIADYEDETFSVEDFTVNQIILEEIRRLIEQKPLNVKKVFYLFYDVGHTIPEIAKLLSMSESNVKHKLYRTLKELRELLK
jgi:RNA polymerase sigma-70 factor (ECF subfamily)